jgi:uncharacterized repeat protein (TIGR02543 family)
MMRNSANRKRILLIAVASMVLVITVAIGAGLALEQEAGAASTKVKVTFNANGGKLTTKQFAGKTKASKLIKKGGRLGALPKAKQTGMVLTGWYTAKKGGTQVTKNTVIKKKQTLYAHWTKVKVKKPTKDPLPPVDTPQEIALTPLSIARFWSNIRSNNTDDFFMVNKDGTFTHTYSEPGYIYRAEGNWKLVGNTLLLTDISVGVSGFFPDYMSDSSGEHADVSLTVRIVRENGQPVLYMARPTKGYWFIPAASTIRWTD